MNKIDKARIFLENGDLKKAEIIYRDLIKSGLESTEIYSNLAIICGKTFRDNEKIKLLKYVIHKDPKNPILYNNLGNTFAKQKKFHLSIKYFKKAIEIKPDYYIFYNNLGNAYKEINDYDLAIIYYNDSLSLNPNYCETYYSLGIIYYEQNLIDSAIKYVEVSLKIFPKYAEGNNLLGILMKEKKLIELATVLQKKAVQYNPNYYDGYWNLSLSLLLSENYKEGLKFYEYRSSNDNSYFCHAKPSLGKWTENKPIKGDKLLIVSEQGLGDTVQFMRYVIYLQNQGVDISFCAQEKLHTLIKSSTKNLPIISPKEIDLIKEGQWLPLLSLPKYLGVCPENPIINQPYLFPNDQLIQKWRTIFKLETKPVIGINWQGNPTVEKTALRGRSIPLESFAPIAKKMKAKFVSVQKGFGSEQLKDCSFPEAFVDCQSQVEQILDFEETAAIIASCDLIITTDTVVAHLAGGLGKKTYLLTQYVPDWRWGLEKETTFWYPSIKLFRQTRRDEWNNVINRILLELEN